MKRVTTARNRALILAAARDVFTELGFEGATVRDIIRRTDFAAGTFYNYFPDKESVFRALLYAMEEHRIDLRDELSSGVRGLDEAIEARYRAYFEYVARDVAMFHMLRRNSGVLGGFFEDPALREGAENTVEWLKDEIAKGRLPELDAEYVAGAIIGVSWEIAMRLVEREPADVDAATSVAVRFTLGGLEAMREGSVALRLDSDTEELLERARQISGGSSQQTLKQALKKLIESQAD